MNSELRNLLSILCIGFDSSEFALALNFYHIFQFFVLDSLRKLDYRVRKFNNFQFFVLDSITSTAFLLLPILSGVLSILCIGFFQFLCMGM